MGTCKEQLNPRSTSYSNQNDSRARNTTKFRDPTALREPREAAGREPKGENAESGPRETTSSGFGGLGLEGMVGMEDPVVTGSTPPGEGKRGEMSGDNGGRGGRAGFSKNAGDVKIVGVCKCSC